MSRRAFPHRGRRLLATAAALALVATGCSAADRALMGAPTCTDASGAPTPVRFSPGQVVLMAPLVGSPLPTGPVPGWDDVVSAASTVTTAAAVHADGTVSVVGSNQGGLLGAGSEESQEITIPQPVAGITDAVSVHAAAGALLVVRGDGTVVAWGDSFITDGGKRRDRSGAGRDDTQTTPQQVPGVERVVDIPGGALNVLALRSDGRVTGWGINLVDSLGDPDGTAVRTLREPPGATSLANAGGAAVTATGAGQVCTWGNNVHGLLGVEPTGGQTTRPVRVADLDRIVQVAGGSDFALALDDDGVVRAWGRGATGTLGDGDMGQHISATPREVAGLPPVARVAASGFTAFAIDRDGGLWAWGSSLNIRGLVDASLPEPTLLPLPGAVQTVVDSLALLDGAAEQTTVDGPGGADGPDGRAGGVAGRPG